MGMSANYFTIVGYDLTGLATDRFDNFKWLPEGERLFNFQSKGYIQLFDDPTSGSHLYLGYVLFDGSEYDYETSKTNIAGITRQIPYVRNLLRELTDFYQIFKQEAKDKQIEIISFVEWW